MFVVISCTLIWILLPLLVLGWRWLATKTQPHFLAIIGSVGVNISFFYLPWLDLSPIKGSVFRDLLDVAPDMLIPFLEHAGKDSMAGGMEAVSTVVGLFELPGWQTLLLNSPSFLLTGFVLLVGFAAILLAMCVSWPVQTPKVGYALAGCSAFLLFVTICFLPEIEELGERVFPHPLALAVPLLQIEIIWLGPLVMFLLLLLMIAGGLVHAQSSFDKDDKDLWGNV